MRAINPANMILLLQIIALVLSVIVFIGVFRYENREVGAFILSPTHATSQEAVVGSGRRVALARALAPYSSVTSTSALSIQNLSLREVLGRSYSSRVYFRNLHHAMRLLVSL